MEVRSDFWRGGSGTRAWRRSAAESAACGSAAALRSGGERICLPFLLQPPSASPEPPACDVLSASRPLVPDLVTRRCSARFDRSISFAAAPGHGSVTFFARPLLLTSPSDGDLPWSFAVLDKSG